MINNIIDFNKNLKSGWDKWDKYIDQYAKKKINCLDIGSHSGDATCWMLENICKNNNSKVFSVDTWDHQTENVFDNNIRKISKEDFNIKMKSNFRDCIRRFKDYGFITFDIIFIDVDREENEVLIDTILAWDLLDLYGILVFYNMNINSVELLNNLSTETSTDISTITSTHISTNTNTETDTELDTITKLDNINSKIIVKNFINLFKLQLVVKYMGDQYIIKKLKRLNEEKPELTEYYKLLDSINNFKLNISRYEFNDIITENIEIDLRYSKNKNLIENTLIQLRLDNINTILDEYPLLKNRYEKSYYKYINELIKDDNLQFNNLLQNFKLIPKNIGRQLIYQYASKYVSNINSKILVLDDYKTYKILNFITKNHNIKKENIYIDNKSLLTKDNYNKILGNGIKYEYIYLLSNNAKRLNNCNNINNIYNILQSILLLNKQSIDGSAFLKIWINLDIINIQMLYILKKYYKSLIFSYAYYDFSGFELYIRLNNFVGINKKELNELNKLVENIFLNINNYTDNCYTINSIAIITSLEFNNFKYNIFSMLKIYLFIFEKHINILKNIYLIETDKNIDPKYLNNVLKTYYSKRIIDMFYNI